MAIQTRYVGDANGVVNVDSGIGSLGQIVATGLTKNPIAISVVPGKSQTFGTTDLATGNSVETILRNIAIDSTITMYQVNSGSISILLEASGATNASAATSTSEGADAYSATLIASGLQSRIQAIVGSDGAGNIAATSGNIWANACTVVGSVNFKLATS
jgi:hypothetical protein